MRVWVSTGVSFCLVCTVRLIGCGGLGTRETEKGLRDEAGVSALLIGTTEDVPLRCGLHLCPHSSMSNGRLLPPLPQTGSRVLVPRKLSPPRRLRYAKPQCCSSRTSVRCSQPGRRGDNARCRQGTNTAIVIQRTSREVLECGPSEISAGEGRGGAGNERLGQACAVCIRPWRTRWR